MKNNDDFLKPKFHFSGGINLPNQNALLFAVSFLSKLLVSAPFVAK